ncbi:hypothetical protein ABH920_008478 [Catenulispora sp. EB89]|uniref:nuclear transport factor 2 family protein n=1 Tax=Catenulispora sp. EB89 TaxID=3156257 RepID=UPI003516DB9F
MTTRGIVMKQQQKFRESALADMARRLPDFTELRLRDMDEHDVDMQVLSLTNNQGLEMQPDPAITVSDADELAVHRDRETSTVVLEFAVHGHLTQTGSPYQNRFVSVITIQNRKVTHRRDYMDSYAAVHALGSAVPR